MIARRRRKSLAVRLIVSPDLGINPPSIACRVFHSGAAVRIAFPLVRLLDGETTGVEGTLWPC